mgnify:FL=1
MDCNGSLFFLAQSNLSDAFDILSTLKTNISACASSYPRGYEYKSDIEETKTIIFNVSSTVSGLTRTISDLKEKLMNLDNVFALNYYNYASQKYQDLVGPLTEEQQTYKEYTQKQFNEQLYKYLDDIKDNLTPEQKEIYDALKEQKVIEKKYNELQKLYEKKDDNNAFWHPVKEENLRQEILALENELREKYNVNINGYSNTWYEDFNDVGTKTSAAWIDAGKSLLKGEGLGKTLDAVKQTVATGAVVCKSAQSGVAKIRELVGDGLLAAGGSIVAGATWLFHDTWSDNDVAGNVMDWTLDQVRRDRVGEANKEFYEKNPIGKWINKNSTLKYDSAGAKTIQKTSKLATEIVIATAAEIGSFGAATPLVTAMFVAEGAGEAAESYAQSVDRNNGESYNYGMALGSTALGGISGAMKSKMYGKIGGNTLNILKNPSLIKTGVSLLKETGAKKILTNELKSTSFWFDFLTTGGQKAGDVVNEYHQTGDINWKKAFTSFAGEMLYARLTDKMTANNVDDLINQKSVFQTFKDMKSRTSGFYNNLKTRGSIQTESIENIFYRTDIDFDDPVVFNKYLDSLTPEQRTKFMTEYYNNGSAFSTPDYDDYIYHHQRQTEYNDLFNSSEAEAYYKRGQIQKEYNDLFGGDEYVEYAKRNWKKYPGVNDNIANIAEVNYNKNPHKFNSKAEYYEDLLYTESKNYWTENELGDSVHHVIEDPDDLGINKSLTQQAKKEWNNAVDAATNSSGKTRLNIGYTDTEVFDLYVLNKDKPGYGQLGMPDNYNFARIGDANVSSFNSSSTDMITQYKADSGIPNKGQKHDRILFLSHDVPREGISMHSGKEFNSYSERLPGCCLPNGDYEVVYKTQSITNEIAESSFVEIFDSKGNPIWNGSLADLKAIKNDELNQEIFDYIMYG